LTKKTQQRGGRPASAKLPPGGGRPPCRPPPGSRSGRPSTRFGARRLRAGRGVSRALTVTRREPHRKRNWTVWPTQPTRLSSLSTLSSVCFFFSAVKKGGLLALHNERTSLTCPLSLSLRSAMHTASRCSTKEGERRKAQRHTHSPQQSHLTLPSLTPWPSCGAP